MSQICHDGEIEVETERQRYRNEWKGQILSLRARGYSLREAAYIMISKLDSSYGSRKRYGLFRKWCEDVITREESNRRYLRYLNEDINDLDIGNSGRRS